MKEINGKEQVTVYLPPEQVREIDILAKITDSSRTGIIEDFVEQKLRTHPDRNKINRFLELKKEA